MTPMFKMYGSSFVFVGLVLAACSEGSHGFDSGTQNRDGQVDGSVTRDGAVLRDSAVPGDTAGSTCGQSAGDGAITLCFNDLAAGSEHVCVRGSDGSICCWGQNELAQLGNGTMTASRVPVLVNGLGATSFVAAGLAHTCAITGNGSLSCWGRNYDGEVGSDSSASTVPRPTTVSALGRDVAQMDGGEAHSCAVKRDGSLWCWGSNIFGQLGDGTTTNSSIPRSVSALSSNVTHVSAGAQHTCALERDGTLWCWGNNQFGQLGITVTRSGSSTPVQVTDLGNRVVEVSAGTFFTCARTNDGAAYCWGSNMGGALGTGAAEGAISSTPTLVMGLQTGTAQIESAVVHTCARKVDGTAWCWGSNMFGQLGNGTMTSSPVPVQVASLGTETATLVAAGYLSCARKRDGSLWCWGDNRYAQLAGATDSLVLRPVAIPPTILCETAPP